MSVIENVKHYQRSIEKCWDNRERMMHCISKLYQLPVTVQHLRDTGVGRTVNSLRKYDGSVGDAAKALVAKWKTMVANEDSSDPEEEDEACVPDAPESYSEPPSPNQEDNYGCDKSRHSNEESRERSKSKSSKSGSSGHNSKHSHKGSSNSEVTNSKNSVHKDRHSKTESKDHESKNRKHSSKHSSESESMSKSSKDSQQNSRRGHDSKDKSRVDSEVGKVSSSTESSKMNGKENHRKRKVETPENDEDACKKKKYSDSESEDDNSRLVMNSPAISEAYSPSYIELDSMESETVSRKITQSCDKTSVRKESSGKDKKRNKERDDVKHKSKSEVEKESHRIKDSKKDDKRRKESHSSSKHSSKSKSSHSSSSSKDQSKNNDAEHEKDKRIEREDKSKTSDSKDSLKEPKEKKKIKKENDEDVEIDSQSGTSFAEALGMCMMPPPSRKRNSNAPSSYVAKPIKAKPGISSGSKPAAIKTDDPELESNPLSLLAPNAKLEPLSVDLASTLPEISPNYKPLLSLSNQVQRRIDEHGSLSEVIYAKNQRTKVFSGNKTGYTSVPSLYELCIRVLIENIEALEATGGVPFYIIKPVLERATPDQLFMLEHHNPYLMEDTDPLWQFHCNREFRSKNREEMESWREMYMRCLDEREAKLKALTANIKQSIDKSQPVRSTIRVHDDFHIKPPRNVLRKQAKYGTGRDLPVAVSEIKKKLISGCGQGNPTNVCSPAPVVRMKTTTSSIKKKAKAPLMAKALQLIKGRYRR